MRFRKIRRLERKLGQDWVSCIHRPLYLRLIFLSVLASHEIIYHEFISNN